MVNIVYLKPHSSFRNKLRSDTLWGALCWAMRMVDGNKKLEDFIKQYETAPPIIISSCYPYKQIGRDKIPYFPKPILPEKPLDLSDDISFKKAKAALRKRKKRKKIKLLSKEDYESFLKGNKIDDNQVDELIEKQPIFKTETVTHNTINRITNSTDKITGWKKVKKKETKKEQYEPITAGQLFHIEEYFLKDPENPTKAQDNVGLYFLVKGDIQLIEGALRYLEHTGIGGDRGTGKGHFEISHQPFKLDVPQDGKNWTNLSLYHPTSKELNTVEQDKEKEKNYYYKLETRQGYYGFINTKTIPKIPKMFFKEGSVFSEGINTMSYAGFNPIVLHKGTKGLDHDVYQYGTAFMVKMKI